MSGVQYLEVTEDENGQRLDRFLQKHLKGTPFGLLQKLMRSGQIRVDSKRVKSATRLEAGQKVRLPPMEEQSNDPDSLSDHEADFVRSLVLYDDGKIIALNKPSGIATQGGKNITRHIDRLLPALKNKDGVAPRLVHRLDRETSGVLLLARSAEIARQMGKLFQSRRMKKIYWALTVPAPDMNEGEIIAPLLKTLSGPHKDKMMVHEDGQYAHTLFDVVDRAHKQVAFVAFWPRTGRTHQIRVHAAHMGCPILGDEKYERLPTGQEDHYPQVTPPVDRLHLHAARIEFRHPKSGKMISLSAPLADELVQSWKNFGFDPKSSHESFAGRKDDME